ncbi:tetraacyldisaccharide 4'-kinase [Roseiterribacter gracilis]|uniref:Tetraacyldisaccharide 4'-kinase n=1 Tax=Roseiterribacter gracilis TaxID=2812848 RepID=A0A8S8XEI9_9PROT|nr:tetraacyldisaccharide 4'-kinase [Rhodospirillales bacterium TMPK1]
MKAPGFWEHPDSALATILSPLGALYALGTRLRLLQKPRWKAPVPVICVGNATAGGSGKTPVVMALARMFIEQNFKVHIITRGYGGSIAGPARVVPKMHTADAVGDEALLLANVAPTWVARDRVAAARMAIDRGARILLLDDGFQDPSLKKSLSLLVVDGGVGFGNGKAIPAGPLREFPRDALRRADALVLMGTDATGLTERVRGIPILRARLLPTYRPELAGKNVYAFAGIGRPKKFVATLQQMGARIVGFRAFADHHKFSKGEQAELKEAAKKVRATLVTTTKDAVRLPPSFADVVEVRASFYDPSALAMVLKKALK